MLDIILAILVTYLVAGGLLIRFLQLVHRRDSEMRKLTAEWIAEQQHPTTSMTQR
jgi:hypothetical protein